MNILALNAGSSGLKWALFDGGLAEVGSGEITGEGDRSASAIDAARAVADGPIGAVGHRVVHGGPRFRSSAMVEESTRRELADLADLAPLHNPPALLALAAAEAALPGVPMVACFDTAFFADLPRAATAYPVPYEWHDTWGIRKYGFHGLSHAYCAGRAAEMLGDPPGLRLVVCHLGGGCSATAILGGRPIETTMGYTPMDGLMMATRGGSIDPGVLLHMLRRGELDAEELDDALNHRSGLLGLSGVSADYRLVEAAAARHEDRSRLALEVYAHRLKMAIGGLSATLGGLDALAFTAGVGEHSHGLRAEVCRSLGFLGVRLDPSRNEAAAADVDVSAADATARVLVLHTCEELVIAREVRRLIPS